MKSISHGDHSALSQSNQAISSMYVYQNRIGYGRDAISVIEVIS